MSCVSQNPPCEDILEVKRQTYNVNDGVKS
jgi:hypothetical protein